MHPDYFQLPPCWLHTCPVVLHLLQFTLFPKSLMKPRPLHPWQF